MKPEDFIRLIAPLAVGEKVRSGVLASITIAQAALESGWGAHAPNNNLFGVKAREGERSSMQTTKECYGGKWVTTAARFRVYDSWAESIADHSDFLMRNPRYRKAGVFTSDYRKSAVALREAGYATDPEYGNLLIRLIETHTLQQYDKEAMMIEQLQREVEELREQLAMPEVPSWATEAVDAAVKAGLVNEPKGRSKDFYAFLVILHRKGLI